MSAETIIADLEADFANMSANGKSFVIALTSRVTALETAFSNLSAPASQALADASSVVTGALSIGASVVAAASDPVTAAIAIGAAAAPVSSLFVSAYNEVHGFIEGLEGQAPAAGATQQETDGAAAGAGVKNLWDAFTDDLKAL